MSIRCKKFSFEVMKINQIKFPILFRRSILFVFQQLVQRAMAGSDAISDQMTKDMDSEGGSIDIDDYVKRHYDPEG